MSLNLQSPRFSLSAFHLPLPTLVPVVLSNLIVSGSRNNLEVGLQPLQSLNPSSPLVSCLINLLPLLHEVPRSWILKSIHSPLNFRSQQIFFLRHCTHCGALRDREVGFLFGGKMDPPLTYIQHRNITPHTSSRRGA